MNVYVINCYCQIRESEACHLQRRFSHRKLCPLWQAPDPVKTTLNSCDIVKQIESIEKRIFFHEVASYFKMKRMYYMLSAEQSVISLTML